MARWDARIGQSRLYPWGDVFDAARCNTSESDIGTATPVARYPTGASAYGAQDVAGNVWEWISSLPRPYTYDPYDGREDQKTPGRRVRRGGSWYDNKYVARTTYRSALNPDGFDDGIGFRLALSPAQIDS